VAFSFTARKGTIIEANLAIGQQRDSPSEQPTVIDTSAMMQKRIHEIGDWQDVIPEPFIDDKYSISKWLNELFGNRLCRDSNHR
jgi:hypothetical protein